MDKETMVLPYRDTRNSKNKKEQATVSKTHGWASKAVCLVKETRRHKHIVWFHLHDVLEK